MWPNLLKKQDADKVIVLHLSRHFYICFVICNFFLTATFLLSINMEKKQTSYYFYIKLPGLYLNWSSIWQILLYSYQQLCSDYRFWYHFYSLSIKFTTLLHIRFSYFFISCFIFQVRCCFRQLYSVQSISAESCL